MKSKFILALDPSGSYYEGKGTTGWCIYNAEEKKIIRTGSLEARKCSTILTFWDKHLQLLKEATERYSSLHIVIEDYRLYASRAEAQINSSMETCKLIGILQYYCMANELDYTMQLAALVKTRWSNQVLEFKNILSLKGKKFYLPSTKIEVNRHQIDSIRHAVHYATFKNTR